MTAPDGAFLATLSSTPLMGSMLGVESTTLLVGIEDDPSGGVRAYLGARYKGVFLLVQDEQDKETFRRAWRSGAAHVWLSPVPPAELLHKDTETANRDSFPGGAS